MGLVVKSLFMCPFVGFKLMNSTMSCLQLTTGFDRTNLVMKTKRSKCLSDDHVDQKMSSTIMVDNNEAGVDKLEALWDDGYGTQSAKDFLEIAKHMIVPDGGPLRWFCPIECGRPLKDSPVLLYLPGMDGLGLGLVLQNKALGKVFEVQCLHIPITDRTPFEGLVNFVESTVRLQHASAPDKPIYIVGDSFGGCTALAVAARNPTMDLVLILVNPSSSFGRSPLQCLIPITESLPDDIQSSVRYLLSIIIGNPFRVAMENIKRSCPVEKRFIQFLGNLIDLLPSIKALGDNAPEDIFLWKLKLQKYGAAYVNSRLHAIKAEVLVLASGKDSLFLSRSEAERLSSAIPNCTFRYFKDSEHNLLMEEGINLLTIIKGTFKYRRSKRRDCVTDFLPPSMSEYNHFFSKSIGSFRVGISPVMFSTMDDGKIVRGLAGVPNDGPVLLVGYHMLFGAELTPLAQEFLKEKNAMIRCTAHLEMFTSNFEGTSKEFSMLDYGKVFGALPVTAQNLFKALSAKSFVVLYPGGIREALHRKGEQNKLFWPDQPEFVRIAAKFGATIVPFGAVGADDIVELFFDYNDQMRIPFINDHIKQQNRETIKLRTDKGGEVSKEDFFVPGFYPKLPGRFYYLFGKPIETKGKEAMLKDENYRKDFYLHIKSEVENAMKYLTIKREDDPYRGIFERTVYRAISAPIDDVPSFEP